MSWSIYEKGKASEVAKTLGEKFGAISWLQGAEAKLKEKASCLVGEAVAACDPESGVNIACSGHADRNPESQTLRILVEPCAVPS